MDKSKYFQYFSNESKDILLKFIEFQERKFEFRYKMFSEVSYPDVVNYLLFAPKSVTAEELK